MRFLMDLLANFDAALDWEVDDMLLAEASDQPAGVRVDPVG